MKTDSCSDIKSQKSEQRRQQVLDAAEKCFREKGFHGSSIANISREAGMSPGHIYYHFADKEAIVQALVERRQHSFSKLLESLENNPKEQDLVSILLKEAVNIVDRHIDPEYAQLILEIASESARNPRVAEILMQSDQRMRTRVTALLEKQLNTKDAKKIEDIRIRLEFVGILLTGLAIRAPTSSTINKKTLIDMIKSVICYVFRDHV